MLAFASLDYVDCRDDTVLWVDFGRVFVPAPGHGTGSKSWLGFELRKPIEPWQQSKKAGKEVGIKYSVTLCD